MRIVLRPDEWCSLFCGRGRLLWRVLLLPSTATHPILPLHLLCCLQAAADTGPTDG